MLAKPLLSQVLDDDALTRGLGDPEARILIEWLVERVETLLREEPCEAVVRGHVGRLCRKGRAIGRFVILWCHQHNRAAALQLAGAERFMWPLPTCALDPCELMHSILLWEIEQWQAMYS